MGDISITSDSFDIPTILWWLISIIVGYLWWKLRRLSESNELSQKETDSKQTNDIEKLTSRVNRVEGHVEVLERLKMSEEQTRKIVSETIEPLREGQVNTNKKLDEMLDKITKLAIQLASSGFDRRKDHPE